METKRKRTTKIGIKILKIGLLLILVCFIGTACAGAFWAKKVIEEAPDISALSFRPQGFATTVYDRDGNITERLVMEGANREEAEYEELPKNLVNAFIAIEDERFWENNGIDLRAILRAAKGVLTGDSSAGGGSTITQQLIKNSVFNGGMEKTFDEKLKRKLQEQYLAVELTKISDKKTIMANYLNTINLGSNTLGVKVAARRYFDKDLEELTLSECAVLAGITQNPSKLNPLTGAEENAARRKRILEKMEEQGMISPQEKEEALADDVYSRIQDINIETKAQATPYSYFTDEVINQVIQEMSSRLGYSEELARKMIYSGGLSIYTTQSPNLQKIVEEEVNNPQNYKETLFSADYRLTVRHLDGSISNYSERDIQAVCQSNTSKELVSLYTDQELIQQEVELFKAATLTKEDEIQGEYLTIVIQPQVSFVLLNQYTGEILAISGGRGEKTGNRTFNRATDSLRQPGSIFKVITSFAPALDGKNASLATVYYDEPYTAGKKSFRNWYGRFFGYSNIRDAIAYSMNIVAVRCMVETVSPQMGVWYAKNLGISTISENDYNPSTALGGITDGVSNLELTAAFGAIGAGGLYTKPVFFTKVLDHDGNVLLENKPETHQALKPETAFLLTDAMKDVMTGKNKFAVNPVNPTGRRAALASMSAAGKSGTTTNNKDLWFVGYTPYYTAGIWSGNDDSQPITGNTSYHKDIWKKIMDRVHEGLENTGFLVPPGINRYQVCRKSGKLAIEGVCDRDPRGNAIYTEYFAQGTEPTSSCDVHVKASICIESEGIATEFCPEIEEKVFLVLPQSGGETEDSQYSLPELCPFHPDEASVVEPSNEEDEKFWEEWRNSFKKWEQFDWTNWNWQEDSRNQGNTPQQNESSIEQNTSPQEDNRDFGGNLFEENNENQEIQWENNNTTGLENSNNQGAGLKFQENFDSKNDIGEEVKQESIENLDSGNNPIQGIRQNDRGTDSSDASTQEIRQKSKETTAPETSENIQETTIQ